MRWLASAVQGGGVGGPSRHATPLPASSNKFASFAVGSVAFREMAHETDWDPLRAAG
jgi:hypothetical protein